MAVELETEPSTARHAVSLVGVGVVFPDGTHALDAVSLSVAPGEIVAVVGPSGCGKSTLLRVVAGLQRPSGGRVDAGASRLGFVFQDPTLLPWRTVLGNVELPAELRRLPRAERRRRARWALDLVGLADVAHAHPRALSGGMRMRASLARALALAPDVLLLDEPFAALDEQLRERLDGELLALQRSQGFAALLVTHSVVEAVHLSNRVVVLSARPARPLAVVDVPFGPDRPPEIRYERPFVEVAREVSATLRAGSGGQAP